MTAQPLIATAHQVADKDSGLSVLPQAQALSLQAQATATLSAVPWRPVLERSAHEWIDRAARHSLPSSSLAVVLDHGTGHWLKALIPLGHRALAADTSRERLNILAKRLECPVSHESAESLQRFAHGPSGPQALLLHAGLDPLSAVIRASGLTADAVCVNSVSASCASPEAIFGTCLPWLKDGGLLLYVGNVFVREKDFEWSTISRTIANHRGIPHQQLFCAESLCDLIALKADGPMRLREHAHDLGMFARPLGSGAWELADVDILEAEGLQHVAPELSGPEEAKAFVFPAADLQLKKIGLVARKKGP